MKKILLLSFSIGLFLFSNAQYPMTGNTLADGEVLVNGVNPGSTGCNSNTGGPSACPQICRNQTPATVTSAGPGLWNIYFNYYNPTSGNKGIRVEILCGNTVLVDQCLDAQPNDQDKRYYKTYTNVPCANLSGLIIRLSPYTGNNCGGGNCGLVSISIGGGSLPVNFKSFTASRNQSNVMVKWETASEQNNRGFAVERNSNGTWQQVGFIGSQASGGNSDAALRYQFIDLNNTKGISQYRIKQIDLDTKSKYSEIKSVRGDGQVGKTIIYPNPSSDGKLNIVFEETNVSRDISVSDMSGRTVKQLKGVTNNNVTIDNLAPGIYSLRIVTPSTGDQSVEKIVVKKR